MSQRDTLNRKCDAITIYNWAQTKCSSHQLLNASPNIFWGMHDGMMSVSCAKWLFKESIMMRLRCTIWEIVNELQTGSNWEVVS